MSKQFDANGRVCRAKEVAVKEALDAGIFTIRGSTGVYTVDLNKGTCTCPDYVYRCDQLGESCKHIIRARADAVKSEVVA